MSRPIDEDEYRERLKEAVGETPITIDDLEEMVGVEIPRKKS